MIKDDRHFQLSGVVTVGPKGQVVIPAEVREKMSIKPGDKLVALFLPGKCSIGFVPESRIHGLIEHLSAEVAQLREVVEKTN